MCDKEIDTKLVDEVPDISDLTGRFGKFQKRILFVTIFRSICVTFTMYSYFFVNQPVPFACDLNETLADYSLNSTTNDSCVGFAYRVEKSTSGQELVTEETVPCESFRYETENSGSSIVEEWDLVCSRKWMISIGYMVFSLGTFSSYLPVGQLSDKFGRRRVTLIFQAVMTIVAFILPFSTSMPMFLVVRFIVGCLYAPLQGGVLAIYIESVGPKYREYVAFSFTAMSGVGIVLVSLTAWLVSKWRTLLFVSSLPIHLTYLVLFYWLVPESTRWLLSTKRYGRAKEQIVKQAEINGKEISDINEVMTKLTQKIELDTNSEKATFVDIFRHKYLRRTALVIYFTLFTTVFITHGLPLTIALEGGSIYLNMSIIGSVNLLTIVIYVLMVKYLKRKNGLLLSLIVKGIVFFAIIPVGDDLFWLKFVLFMIGRISSSITYCLVYMYTNELFPTNMRAVGVNGAMTCGRIGSMMSTSMDYLGRFHGRQVPLFIYGALALSSIVAYFLLPNTEDKHLPNTISDINKLSEKRETDVHFKKKFVNRIST